MRYDLRISRKYTSKRNQKSRGVTFIELLIAIVILGIVMAIAIPSFKRIVNNGNLKTAARDLIADFNALKGRAMAENTPFVLNFDVANNKYTVTPSSGLPNGGKSPASISSDLAIQSTSSPPLNVTVLTRGTLSQPGSVVLTNSRGSTATITFNLSGRSYVQFSMQ